MKQLTTLGLKILFLPKGKPPYWGQTLFQRANPLPEGKQVFICLLTIT